MPDAQQPLLGIVGVGNDPPEEVVGGTWDLRQAVAKQSAGAGFAQRNGPSARPKRLPYLYLERLVHACLRLLGAVWSKRRVAAIIPAG